MISSKDGIIGFAIGDAMGVPVEFTNREKLMRNPITSMEGFMSHNVPKGTWSDDTSMTIATMDSIINSNGDIIANDMANRFLEWMEKGEYTPGGKIVDIDRTTLRALGKYKTTRRSAVNCGCTSNTDNGNGSLMRMLPIVYYSYLNWLEQDKILKLVAGISSITHANELVIMGCYMYVNYAIELLNTNNRKAAYSKIQNLDYSMFSMPTIRAYTRILDHEIYHYGIDEIKSSSYIVDTLEAQFSLNDTTLTANLTNNVTSASYCTTTGNICTPNTSASISNNSYTVELEELEEEQVVCTQLNGTSKIICSNGVEVKPLCPEGAEACNTILAGKNIDDSRNGAITGTLTTNTTGTVYSVADDWGTSYVYAGAPTDNWVSFAGFYWRIIRINGDGSIRMIYAGTSTSTSGTDDQISTSAYNSSRSDNAYVGYMYGSTGASSYSATHANTNNSTIKGILDSWYKTNIVDKGHSDKVSTEAGFCNDRSLYSGDGIGQHASFYQGRQRLKDLRSPSFRCTDSEDWLDVVIGLITADEVAFAGGLSGNTITYSNDKYYLYTGNSYWTMTPSEYTDANPKYSAQVFPVLSDGGLGSAFVGDRVSYSYGVRPVINLKADTKFWGSGTSTDPYVVN